MAKQSKSLLNQTSKKSKKQDKYSDVSDIKTEYKFEVSDKIKLIYLGLIDTYKNQECIVTKRSRRRNNEYYKILFDDGMEAETSNGFLMTLDEYEEYLLEQENSINKDNNNNDISEFELELMSRGIRSHKNYEACLSPKVFYNRQCDACGYSSRCVYNGKYKYKKLD